MAQVPAFVTKVGLFVNDSETRIREHLARLPIDLLQFHGDESGDFCSSFGCPWIKAARVGEGFDLLEFSQQYSRFPGIVGVLADACVDGFGGSGKTFDWSLVPEDLPLPLILSGGLTSSNVEEAIRIVKPWAVDVSSGVEPVSGTEANTRLYQMMIEMGMGELDNSAVLGVVEKLAGIEIFACVEIF